MTVRAEGMRIGVLADTHMPYRLPQLPASVVETFAAAGPDLILHAGDVDDPQSLEPLNRLAPVVAVQGNLHLGDLSRGGSQLPFHAELMLCGRRLIVTHGHRPGLAGLLGHVAVAGAYHLGLLSRERINRRIARRLRRRFPWADVVVFGHTHQPFRAWMGRAFFFNPGGVAQDRGDVPSVGLLTLRRDSLQAEIIPLLDG